MQTALAINCEGCRSVLSTYPSCESLRIRSLANQTIDVLQALRGGHRTSILAVSLPWEVSLGLSRWGRCYSGSSSRSLSRSGSWRVSRSGSASGAHAAVSSTVAASVRISTAVASTSTVAAGVRVSATLASTMAAGVWISTAVADASGVAGRHGAGWIDNVISALLQSLLSLATDTTVTVSQSDGQSFDDTLRAAALVLAEFVANLVGGSPANAVIRIVQTIDEG